MESVLACVDTCASGTTLSKQITVLNAVKWCGKAWNEVSERTIKNVFRIVALSGMEFEVPMQMTK